MKQPSLILADDHRMVLDGLELLLRPHFDVVACASDGKVLVQKALELRPDLVLSDVSMPALGGVDAARRILAGAPKIRIVLMTMNDNQSFADDALCAGVSGYVLKTEPAADVLTALDAALDGRQYVSPMLRIPENKDPRAPLTTRQQQVLQGLRRGLTMKQVGSELHISPRTVAFHKYRVMGLLGVRTNAELIARALYMDLEGD
jgi:DNA-binding NarL/FixJ family response regulator